MAILGIGGCTGAAHNPTYTDGDLAVSGKRLVEWPRPGYLMFNNFSSKADALRFRELSQLRACE